MSDIKLNISAVEALSQNINNAKNSIDTSVSSIPVITQCSGIKITDYVDRIKTISSLLDLYKQLLEKDISDIQDAKSSIEVADSNATKVILNK